MHKARLGVLLARHHLYGFHAKLQILPEVSSDPLPSCDFKTNTYACCVQIHTLQSINFPALILKSRLAPLILKSKLVTDCSWRLNMKTL